MIEFLIGALGWLDCSIETENNQVRISHSSDYGDKFQELLNIFFILEWTSFQPKSRVPHQMHTLIWTDDFANFKWYLTYSGSQSIDIEISKSYIEIPEASERVIKFNISVDEFSEQLYLSLKKMLSIYGLVGFKNAWEVGNFPVAEYIRLSAKYNNIHLNESNTFDDDDGGLMRVNLENELQILRLK